MRWSVRTNQNGSSELMHYGILGMKWGIRRTPEQLGHRKPKKRLEGAPLKYKSPIIDKAKAWTVWAGKNLISNFVPGAGLIFNAKLASDLSKQYDIKNYKKGSEKLSELKRKPEGTKTPMAEDAKKVNKTGRKGYVKNCFNCVCALEMRQRGYDVEALPTKGDWATEEHYKQMFKGVKLKSTFISRENGQSRKDWVLKNYDALCKELEKNPEGSRGFIGFAYEGTNSGHTISWSIENGQAVFYDPQVGKRGADKVLSFSDQHYTWGRLDNTKESETITQIIKSKKGKK